MAWRLVSNSLHSEPEPSLVTEIQPPSAPPSAPATANVAPPTSHLPPKTQPPQPSQSEAPVIKSTLSKKNEAAPLLAKEPGWYQQMFQTFTNKVEEAFPGGTAIRKCESFNFNGAFWSRGGHYFAVEKTAFYIIIIFTAAAKSEKDSDTPTYVYDERGLRVRSDSVSKIQEVKQIQEDREKMKSKSRTLLAVMSIVEKLLSLLKV